MAAFAILFRASGEWVNFSLLVEGEVLFLAGFFWGQKYLRQLAVPVFAASIAKLLMLDVLADGSTVLFGRTWASWSPTAALTAAVFYVNRILRVAEGVLYSSVAAGLIGMLLGYETPRQYLCVSWLAFAAVLFELGFRWRQPEFRYQSYIIGALGSGAGLAINSLAISVLGARSDWPLQWLPLAICAALLYAATLRIGLSSDGGRLSDTEKNISWISAALSIAFLFVIVWKLVPGGYLGAAWVILGAVLFELGLQKLPQHFRWLSYFVSAAGIWNLFWDHVVQAQNWFACFQSRYP